jgi:signal transduction histidine kinase/CheY-like chemotaxis protein
MAEAPDRHGPTDQRSGWLIVRDDGTVVAAERRACSLLSAPDPDALVGRDWTSLVAFGTREPLSEARAAIEVGSTWTGTLLYRYAHDEVTLSTTITPVPRATELFVVSLEQIAQPRPATSHPREAVSSAVSSSRSTAAAARAASPTASTTDADEPRDAPPPPPRTLGDVLDEGFTPTLSSAPPGGFSGGHAVAPLRHPDEAHLHAQVSIHEALRGIDDPAAAARAVLQSLTGAVSFDWGTVLRIRRGEVNVVAVYPGPMAGVGTGARWSPPGDAETALRRSGEPSLAGDLEVVSDTRTPLDRLPAFGLRSRLLIPLYAGSHVAGAVAIYRSGAYAFDAQTGIAAERLVRPLGEMLNGEHVRAATSSHDPVLPVDDSEVEPPAPTPGDAIEIRTPRAPERPTPNAPIAPRMVDPADHLPASRLESLGELVAGVAHELNNPLTAILGYAQILSALDESERAHAIHIIEDEAQRAARIVRNLLSFARQRPGERRPTDIESVLRRIIDLRRYSLEVDDVRVITRFGHVPEVRVDEGQFEQVFLNLLSNAHQALKASGGEVVISTWSEETAVYVSFADDGPGVPEGLRGRVFEPFFTTRDVGAGQGMGLSIVYGVVTNHNGRTWVEPSPSGGANFIIELPAGVEPLPSETPQAPSPVQQREPSSAPVGTGLILVVDDEPPVRALTQEILQANGYRVETAESGAQALRMLEHEVYSLVVTDLRMPGISGAEMYHQIEKRWPALAERVLFVTGDIEGERDGGTLDRERIHYLEKPFTTQQLLAAIRRILR